MRLEKKWVLVVWVEDELRMVCSFEFLMGLTGFVAREPLPSGVVLAAMGSQSPGIGALDVNPVTPRACRAAGYPFGGWPPKLGLLHTTLWRSTCWESSAWPGRSRIFVFWISPP